MKKQYELIKNFREDYYKLLEDYSSEFGKLKGGIIRCELADLTKYEVYDSVLEAANNDYGLTDKIISEICDGKGYVVYGDNFYSFYTDYYKLPGIYSIVRQKRDLSEEDKQQLLVILGPKCGECID